MNVSHNNSLRALLGQRSSKVNCGPHKLYGGANNVDPRLIATSGSNTSKAQECTTCVGCYKIAMVDKWDDLEVLLIHMLTLLLFTWFNLRLSCVHT